MLRSANKVFQVLLIFILSLPEVIYEKAFCSTGEPGASVKIGLLIPDNKSVAARQGAELAIRIANEKNGFMGIPFELVVKSMEGRWGIGSKQAVNLIFEEKVWALLGSHDGRNAHLVEQAATKAIVPFVSVWAGDPTLAQAFVPWFFNCVPNDLQQAELLVQEIYLMRNINKVAIISYNDYDSNQATNNFLKKAKLENKPDPKIFNYQNYIDRMNELLDQVNNSECIVLFCNPSISLNIFKQIRERKMTQSIFSTHYILNENILSDQDLKYFDNSLLIISGKWSEAKIRVFTQEYRKTYGESPGIVAAYAYDGMNLLIEAIKNAGTSERKMIQEALKRIHYEGVTGTISFDNMGNRKGLYYLTTISNGIPVIRDK